MGNRFRVCAGIVAALLLGGLGQAQEPAPLKVTTTLHGDGTRTDTQIDSDARTGTATTMDAAGKVLRKVEYQLDEANQPKAALVYNGKGVLVYKAAYKRDGAGRVIEEANYTANDQLVRRLVYTYGANDRVTNVQTFDASGREVTPPSPAKKDPKKRPPRTRR
jgi:hypothetical protein